MDANYKTILDKQIKEFLKAIKYKVSIDRKTIHPFTPDYPIFMPEERFNDSEKAYYRGIISWYIRDYLITGIITKWLKASGRKCYVLKASDRKCYVFRRGKYRKAPFMYSNTAFGRDYPFAFIVENKNNRIGYRYSTIEDYSHLPHVNILTETHSDLKILSLFNKYQINRITTIEWENTTSLTSRHKCNIRNEDLSKHIDYITICGFITEYFSDELCQYYINSIRKAVEEAYKEIGYQTVSNLSPKHLSDFREQIIKDLEEFDLKNTHYSKFSRDGNLEHIKLDLLQQNDYDIISNICFNNKIVYSLTGQHDFAKCFITSEHLYHIFKTDSQCYYDYSAIVSGYLKSVELLLKEALDATFSHPNHERLWMKGKKDHLSDDDIYLNDDDPKKIWRYDLKSQSKEKNKSSKENNKQYSSIQLKLVEINKGHFSEEMGPLIWFLDEDENTYGWNISDASKRILIKCLKNYNQGCRNAYFHKKIISDFNIVEAIRTNTILCLLYLLGGYKIYDEPSVNYTNHTAVDQEYNRFYKAVKKIPSSVDRFVIKPYNQDEIMAIRFYDQNKTEYDDIGNIITGIEFAIVDSLSIVDYRQFLTQIQPGQKLTISKDNIPEKMWRIFDNGQEIKRVEINWKA